MVISVWFQSMSKYSSGKRLGQEGQGRPRQRWDAKKTLEVLGSFGGPRKAMESLGSLEVPANSMALLCESLTADFSTD